MSQVHSQNPQQAAQTFGVNSEQDLSDAQAAQRLNQYGKNSLVGSVADYRLGLCGLGASGCGGVCGDVLDGAV
jgi:hypothetical protein